MLTPEKIRNLLWAIPVFKDFTFGQISCLARLPLYCWEEGAVVIEEGKTNAQMVVLLTGRVSVEKRMSGKGYQFERINQVNAPALVGENAYITGLPNSVTLRADGFVDTLQIPWEEFFRLEKLGEETIIEFLRKLGMQNLRWAEQQAGSFLSTIRTLGGELRKLDLDYFARVVAYKTEISDPNLDFNTMIVVLKEICLLLRRVNESQGELYQFANMKEAVIQRFDSHSFRLDQYHRYYKILRMLIDQIAEMQGFVPMKQLQIKNMLVGILLEKYKNDRRETRSNYANFLKKLNEIYKLILTEPESLGLVLQTADSEKTPVGTH